MSKISITNRDFGKAIQVPTGERVFVQVSRFEGFRVEMEDVNFHFDSAVLLPDPKCDDDPGVPDQDRITGLAVLRVCYLHAQDNPDQELLVVGHTDTTGDPAYNLTLSQLRADNVLFALTGDRDQWVKSSFKKYKVEDAQHILKWIATTFGWACDPGVVDNEDGIATRTAVQGFQTRYNLEFDQNIAVDGVVGADTWGAIFDVYMLELKTLLETDDAGLQKLQGQLKFLQGAPKTVGCGESHPILGAHEDRPSTAESESSVAPTLGQPTDPNGADDFRSVTNRRVELLFFEPAHRPKLDCHPAKGKCKPDLCEIYRVGAFHFEHLPCDPRKGTAPQVSWVTTFPDGVDADKINLVIADEGGKELQRMPGTSATDGSDGTKVFDLSELDPSVTVVLQLVQDDDPLGTKDRLVIADLRRALAQQDAATAAQQLSVVSSPATVDPLDGSDPGLAVAIAQGETADPFAPASPSAPSAAASALV